MKLNNRIANLPVYHFKKIDDIKRDLMNKGIDVTDLGVGDPDLSVHKDIISGLIKGVSYSNYNQYPPYEGINELKNQIIKYYDEVFSVKLTSDEVIILIGSKDGIAHIFPALCSIGDYAIIPDPAYPIYEIVSSLWGIETFKMPLSEGNDYLPKLGNIPQAVASKSKMMMINYPNNPTGAVADASFFKEVVNFCNSNNIVLCNDAAYNEIIGERELPISILQYDQSKASVEFGTFSKTYNMTGFRIGYAVGNVDVIKALLTIKSNMDSGQFIPIQCAAIEALKLTRDYIYDIRKIYCDRRKLVENILKQKNLEFYKSKGTFYVWGKIPKNYTTMEFCTEILRKHRVIITPGFTFGSVGHDNFRIALTRDKKVLQESLNKIDVY